MRAKEGTRRKTFSGSSPNSHPLRKTDNAGLAFIQMQLGLLLKHLQADTIGQGEVHPDAVAAVKVLQHELGSPMPERDRMDQALRVIDGVSSVAAMAGKIRTLLSGLF